MWDRVDAAGPTTATRSRDGGRPRPCADAIAVASEQVRARTRALTTRSRSAVDASAALRREARTSVTRIRMERLGREIDRIAPSAESEPVLLGPDDWAVVVPPAELDGAEAEAFSRETARLARDVMVDMRGVRLLSARGARALYALVVAATARGRTVVACDPSPLISRVMEVTGLTVALPVVPRAPHHGAGDESGAP